ncbi:MAG: hypothetical protein LBQ35_07200 [Spirochaetaceae bacterium]|jgi:hypothetical protein|nr:hypothetical protein [Spirochaetaceae bacterium]
MKRKQYVFFGVVVLLMAAIFTLSGCDNGNGPETGDMVKFTITGLNPGTKYFITPVSGPLSLTQEDEYSGVADSSGSVSVSYQYSYLERHGLEGDCYVKYHIYDDKSNDHESTKQYSIVAGANITLDAAIDFDD